MKIVEVKIKALKPAEYNPRQASDRQWGNLKRSIKKFGIVDPIIVNKAEGRKNVIIGGHFRVKVAESMGYTTVPVYYVNIKDIEDEKELNLRLNKNQGVWDWDKLANYDDDFLRKIGFEENELKKLFDDEDKLIGEIPFTSEVLEENNYVVFIFNNVMDWGVVVDKLGIKTVQALDSKKGYKRTGVGRVLDGKKLVKLLEG